MQLPEMLQRIEAAKMKNLNATNHKNTNLNRKFDIRIVNTKTSYLEIFTLNALEIVDEILSRTKPPANVPKIPQSNVTPPNIISAFFCQKSQTITK